MPFWLRALLSLVLFAAVGVFLFWLAVFGSWYVSRVGPFYEYFGSPTREHVVIRQTWGNALDAYDILWIANLAEVGDRERWVKIAPTVDGWWSAEWIAPDHLVLRYSEFVAEDRDLHEDQRFGAVRIQTLRPGDPGPRRNERPPLPDTQEFTLRLESATLPYWRVESVGKWRFTREIHVRRDRPVEFAVSSDRDCSLTIESMHVGEVLPAEWSQTVRFMPTTAGVWDVQVRVGGIACDGLLVVEER